MAELRVVLIDDHEVVRIGLRGVLEDAEGIAVVGVAATGADGVDTVVRLRPELVVVDLALPDMTGIEVCREICGQVPDTACMLYTNYDDDEAVISAAMAGASAYLTKATPMAEVVDVVRRVGAGEQLLEGPAVRDAVERHVRDVGDDPRSQLTPQEQEVFERLTRGLSNQQIAEEMGLAEKTIKHYVSKVLGKLDLSRRAEAIALAMRLRQDAQRSRRQSWRATEE